MQTSLDAIRRAGAYSVIGAAVAVVFAMAHHPTGFSGGLVPLVHGVMIVLVMVLCFGFTCLTLWQGVTRPATLAAILVYLFGAVCNIGAATLSGFVSPALLANGQADMAAAMAFSWESHQALARWAVYMTGAAYGLFSVTLLREPSAYPRAAGTLGIVVGLLPVLALISGRFSMSVSVATVVYALHMLWALAIGVYLLRARTAAPGEDAD
ncbi:MAG: hypothetical protein AB8G17_01665 [Gammaproteobacteria bacterium]